MSRSGVVKFYKSQGAAQFSIIPVRRNQDGFVDKEGAILVEVAPGDGNRSDPTWDWSKKIKFAVSVADIANLLDTVDPKAGRIFHKHQDTPKTLEFQPGQGDWAGTFKMVLAQGKGSDRNVVMVPLTNGEYGVVMRLLVAALPKLVGWD